MIKSLTPEQLARIAGRFQNISESTSQGIDFKPKVGTYEIRILPIPNSVDLVFQEVANHPYPGENNGWGTCNRSLGNERCFECELIEMNQDTQDPLFAEYLNSMRAQPPRYAMKLLVKSPQTGQWLGPLRWKARSDQFTKFQDLFANAAKFGNPLDYNLVVRFGKKPKSFRGYDIITVETITMERQPSEVPVDLSQVKDVDIVRLSMPKSDEDIYDKLLDGPMGIYLRQAVTPEPAQQFQDDGSQEYAGEGEEAPAQEEAAPEEEPVQPTPPPARPANRVAAPPAQASRPAAPPVAPPAGAPKVSPLQRAKGLVNPGAAPR